MAFIFSTSHLPETRVRRPDHLEDDEEDEDVMQPMPRAGGVRAFSHLPVRDNPAPSTAPLRDDSPRGGIAPIPPRSATPVGRPRPYVDPEEDIETDHDLGTSHAPEPDSDHDDNNAPRSHDYQDDSPWYMPRITAQDLPPQAHDEDVGRSSLNRPVRDSGFDDAHSAERSTSTTRDNGFSPSPQDLRDDFHAPAPDSPTREAPAQNISPALPRGRIFEKRLPPGLRSQGTGQFQSLADKPEYHDLVYRPRSVEHERHQADGFFQNVAAPLESRQNQSSPQTPQTISQSAVPQSPSINGQTPKRQLTRAELELISPDGKLMHPVGQLGITALNTIRDPNKTASGKKPKTVCLYDGQEIRTKDAQHYEADAAALHQAAATYASNASWMIDISNPNWQQQLEQIRDAEERNGSGIDRIMIFDHGDSTGQEFGATRLDPYSPEWQAITSCIRTGGDIVLMGCEVAKKDANGNGPDYLYELYRNSNGKRRPKIHAYDGRVRHRENKLQHSVTEGEEHTIPLD